MSFLRLMPQAGARHRWRSWLALTLLTAVVVGLVLIGAATACRTARAFPRFEAAHGYDAFFYSVNPVPQAPSLPEVASVTRVMTPGSGPPTCACRPISVNDFALDEVPPERLTQVVKLVSGCLPDQSDPDQVLASEYLQLLGGHVGSVLRIPLVASSQRCPSSRPNDAQPSRRVRSSIVSRRTTTRAVPSETKRTAGRGTLL